VLSKISRRDLSVMFYDLRTIFFEYVVEAFLSYKKEKASGVTGRSKDIVAAIKAAYPLYHLREHLPDEVFLSALIIKEKCPDYDLLQDVVNVSKHGRITHKENSQIKNATEIKEAIVISMYKDQIGPYQHAEKEVLLCLADGSYRTLDEILTNTMNFWQEYLFSRGITNKVEHYEAPKTMEPRKREDCNGCRMGMDITPGVPLKKYYLLLEYNYETNKMEPYIPIDDLKINFTFNYEEGTYTLKLVS
jgi:hypothetical protein